MRKWVELAERCEKAMGPDREIDAAMAKALGLVPPGLTPGASRGYEARFSNSAGLVWDAPYYTTSLDAIAALIERKLPGWRVRWHTDGDGVHEAFLEDKGDFDAIDARHTETFAASPALALCAAFCRAMNEKEANA